MLGETEMADAKRIGHENRLTMQVFFLTCFGLGHSKQTLNAAKYEAARIAMTSLKGDFGARLGIMPNLLVVPPAPEGAAQKILKSENLANGDTNEWAGTAEVLVTPWLA